MKTKTVNALGFDPGRLDRISAWMQSYVDRRRFAGCATLISRAGQEVWFGERGQRNIEEDLPFERDTVARIYSMTKPVTSVAIMMLAERGLFHLNAPVSEFIPAFADMQALIPGATSIDQTEPCATPTIHQLLTHTSGLSYHFNIGVLPTEMEREKVKFGGRDSTLAEGVARLAALPLAFAPGRRWEYSEGTSVLGRVVEIVTGRSLDTVFADDIFEPLGMTQTAFSVPEGVGNRFASLYSPLTGDSFALNTVQDGSDPLRCVETYHDSAFHDVTSFSGGGGLVGTIDDYMRFAEMLRQGGALNGARLLSPKTVAFMMSNHLPGDIASMGPSSFAEMPTEGVGFGLGGAVFTSPARSRTLGSVGDFGWGGMASTYFWVDPVNELSVIFFTQLSPSSSYPNRPQLKALVHGAMLA